MCLRSDLELCLQGGRPGTGEEAFGGRQRILPCIPKISAQRWSAPTWRTHLQGGVEERGLAQALETVGLAQLGLQVAHH